MTDSDLRKQAIDLSACTLPTAERTTPPAEVDAEFAVLRDSPRAASAAGSVDLVECGESLCCSVPSDREGRDSMSIETGRVAVVAAELDKSGRRWWAPVGLGAALCVVCCVAPILIAAGVIGGGVILVGLSWLEPLGFALLGIGLVGLIWSRARTRRTGCGNDSAGTGCASTGCGCADTGAAMSAGSVETRSRVR